MSFIRRRVTKTGVVSTALVESYRKDGKPRHRIIANLHGAETLETALGRLAAERDALRKERKPLEEERPHAERFYEIVTLNTLDGHIYSQDERKEIDRLMRKRKRLLKRLAEIDRELERIQREGVAIRKHCSASAEAIRKEAGKHAEHLREAEHLKIYDEFRRSGKSVEAFLKSLAR
jgi:DNA repair exonuclease SbcCD ATPase subunit